MSGNLYFRMVENKCAGNRVTSGTPEDTQVENIQVAIEDGYHRKVTICNNF